MVNNAVVNNAVVNNNYGVMPIFLHYLFLEVMYLCSEIESRIQSRFLARRSQFTKNPVAHAPHALTKKYD